MITQLCIIYTHVLKALCPAFVYSFLSPGLSQTNHEYLKLEVTELEAAWKSCCLTQTLFTNGRQPQADLTIPCIEEIVPCTCPVILFMVPLFWYQDWFLHGKQVATKNCDSENLSPPWVKLNLDPYQERPAQTDLGGILCAKEQDAACSCLCYSRRKSELT